MKTTSDKKNERLLCSPIKIYNLTEFFPPLLR